MKLAFPLIICLNLVAILLVAVGFFMQKPAENSVVDETSTQNVVDSCSDAQPQTLLKNLVLVVIDAFRDEFFFRFDTMRRLRALVRDGSATAFQAHAYHPTVTMPRIKSIISGSISTYSDLIMNFASSRFAGDNFMAMAKRSGKRIVFYGDETWLSMLPTDVFETRSEGVSSFYVMDYTEVDNNVTRHLAREFTPTGLDTWDVMVLHYLGLDHVGHSIGGDNEKIHVKLDEMDAIMYNLTLALSRQRRAGEFALVVLGDHGMTLEGGHGGASALETHVPVVVVRDVGAQNAAIGVNNEAEHLARNSRKFHTPKRDRDGIAQPPHAFGFVDEIEPAAQIEQVDVAPTLCALLDLPHSPASSIGVPFYAKLVSVSWRHAAAKLRDNALQFMRLLDGINEFSAERHSEFQRSLGVCLNETAALCALKNENAGALENRSEATFRRCESAMRNVQHEILERITSSNRNDFAYVSIGLSSFALLLSLINAFGLRLQNLKLNAFKLVFIQPFLLFSSSFVEQEHEIWYFILPLFILKILWDDGALFYAILGRTAHTRKWRAVCRFAERERWPLIALALHRIGRTPSDAKARRWLLFADSKTVDFGLGSLLESDFTFVSSIFSENAKSIAAAGAILAINWALIWRNARTLRHTRFLAYVAFFLVFCHKLPLDIHFVYVERVVQLALIWLFLARRFALALSLYVAFVMRPITLPFFLLAWALGYAIGKIRLANNIDSAFLLLSAIYASFYYTGNTISIASIDVAPGYTGLPAYWPAIVAAQILLNVYAGPICVFLGWYQAMTGGRFVTSDWKTSFFAFSSSSAGDLHNVDDDADNKDLLTRRSTLTSSSGVGAVRNALPALIAQRCAALLAALVASHYFRHHLFVWTVFTPRLLYEVVHFATFSLFVFCALLFAPRQSTKHF